MKSDETNPVTPCSLLEGEVSSRDCLLIGGVDLKEQETP